MVKVLAALIALFLTSPMASAADTASAPQPQPTPQSIWQIGPDGGALHLQSQWICAAAYGDYRRDQLEAFDKYGLDVGCNYRHTNQRDDITLYITKSTGGDIKAAFDQAAAGLVKRTADATPLPESQQITFASARPWLHRIYSIYDGKAHDGVWYAWFGDWLFEIRATYPSSGDAAVMAVMAQMVEHAERMASAHLDRCAKAPIPARSGVLVTDQASQSAAVLMLIAMSGNIAVDDRGGHADGPVLRAGPSEWCAEAGVEGAADPILIWHAVDSTGKSLPLDRVSVMTLGPAPFLEASEPMGSALPGLEMAEPKFVVSRPSGEDVFIYAVFNNRPQAKTLAALLSDAIHDRAKPLAKGNPKTNNITVFTDQKK